MEQMNLETVEKIRTIAGRRNLNMGDIAEGTGQTRQNFSNKMKRGDFKESELRSIAEILNCSIKISFIDNETGTEL